MPPAARSHSSGSKRPKRNRVVLPSSPAGRWLVAAGQLSHRVCSHGIDPVTGALGPVGASLAVGADSTWVEIVALA